MAEESPKDEKKAKEAQAEEAGEEPAKEKEPDDRLLRLAAEFDNYKKRVAKEISASKEMGRIDVVSKLLPTLDEFELALDSVDKKDDHLKGIELVYLNFISTLKSFGLREIDVDGKFDPYRHEIMLVQESDREDGTIVKVVRKGYMLNTIMLRPASVIVAKSESGTDKKNEKKEKGE